nr:hypothetical protein [Tanacetum cinerariifolium]
EEAGIQLNAERADWRDDNDDDELEDHELEAHYMYMAQLQEVSLDAADSGPIFDDEPLQKVLNDDHYNVFAIESAHLEEEIDQNDDDNDLSKEREIEDFKNKNKSLESSNNFFKEANNRLSKTNNLLYTDYKKSEAELVRRNSKEYASQMEFDCAKVRGDFLSYKMESQKSCTKYTDTINDLNQTISEMKDKLSAQQENISILSQQKEAQIKLYKTQEDKELDKVIKLEQKFKVLDNIIYKIGQSVQMMNMLNNKCQTSFAKPVFLKKAQRANPCLYDIGCYNDNLALMLAPDSDEVIRLEKESRSKLSDLIRPERLKQGHVARECQKPKRAKDAAYHREKMLMCKQEEARIQLNAKQAEWRDDIDDDELEDQELEAHYMYMAQLQEVSPDAADSGPIFDDEPLQKVLNDDHYNVFAIENAHPGQFTSVHDTYPIE